jgi:predicted small lipoprotein YifL
MALGMALLAGGALALAGCGVRGSLEAPAAEPTDTGNATPGTPGQPAPHKPSILDPILR